MTALRRILLALFLTGAIHAEPAARAAALATGDTYADLTAAGYQPLRYRKIRE